MQPLSSGPLFGSATPREAPVNTAALKDAVREALGLRPEDTVVVQELACTEPGCPPVETVIAVLAPDRPPRRWTMHSPVADVMPHQVREALTGKGGHTG